MPIERTYYKGEYYLELQTEGNAARWIMPLAKYYCDPDGTKSGVDIGCNRKEWAFPNALMVDPAIVPTHHAMNIPCDEWDFIFSSHCLEHIKENWMNVLDYWLSKVKNGGILFLYLPHSSQKYWLPENNRKHIHSFNGTEIYDYLKSLGHDVILTPVDFNNSFAIICEKKNNTIYEKN